jgi:hypothetical protein
LRGCCVAVLRWLLDCLRLTEHLLSKHFGLQRLVTALCSLISNAACGCENCQWSYELPLASWIRLRSGPAARPLCARDSPLRRSLQGSKDEKSRER